MSSGADKAVKSKGKAPAKPPKTKSTKAKEVSTNDQRFRGDGVKFKCKIVGTADVASARGDSMCAEAIKRLKAQALKSHKESGEHKQKIILYINVKGIRIMDERTLKVQYEHPINKISFITHDPEDKRIFGYVCSQPCTTGHKIYAIKSEKPAGAVTGTLYELFQIVFKMRQEAGLSRKVQNAANNSSQMSNGPQPRNSPGSDGIYEVPYKNGKNKHEKTSPQLDHEYAEPVQPPSRKHPHYKVPNSPPLPATPSSQTKQNSREDVEEKEMTASTHVSNQSTHLSQSKSFDKEPDQVSQASIPDSPFPSHDSTSNTAFFGSSVFEATLGESGMADTVSVASSADVSMIRTGSVSSGSSETQSMHSRSDSMVNQAANNEGTQVGFATSFDSNSDAGSASDIKTTDEGSAQTQTQENFSISFPSFGDKEKSEISTDQETSFSYADPFASSAADSERTQPVTGGGFFTESFASFDTAFGNFETKDDDAEKQKSSESSSDPFASSGGTQEKDNVYENVEIFASETNFEAAFSSEPFSVSKESTDVVSDVSEVATDEKPFDEKSQSAANTAVSFSWDNAFTEVENKPKPDATQSSASSEQQFSWAEDFASDDGDIKVKTDPNTAASFTWDDAFGGAAPADKESTWDHAFGGKTKEGSNSLFDSSPFGDTFTSSTEDSSGNKQRGSEDNLQSVPESTNPDNSSFFDDSSFAPSLSPQSNEGNAGDLPNEKIKEDLAFSNDPFEEFNIGTQPVADLKEIAPEENTISFESEVNTPDQDSAVKEVVSNIGSFEINPKETVVAVGTSETVIQLNNQVPVSVIKDNLSEEGDNDQMNEEKPSDLQVLEAKLSLSQRPISPSSPPPLPPRPVVSAPPLPARPPSSNSTGMSPMSPCMSTGSPTPNSPQQGKTGSAKKKPPPPPPRVDLNEQSSVDPSNQKGAFPDPFGSDLFDDKFDKGMETAGQESSDWMASWPSAPELPQKEKTKDPFNDSFFTDFDFPQNTANNTSSKDNLDPFATTDPTSEPFPSGFGNEDLFAAFTPAKVETAFDIGDPFQNDMSNSFAAFTSDDPFSDISDPFADRGILSDDPFADSPSKLQAGESLTLNESLVASDDADSFA